MVVASFRSHFFKHLLCTSFSSIRSTPNLTPGPGFTREYPLKFSEFLNLTSITAAYSSSSSSSSSPSTASEILTTGSYLSVDIRCRQDVADMLSEALLCFGATSTSIVEPDSFNSDDEISIGSIFCVSEDVHQSILQAADSIGLKETPVYNVTMGYQSDWIENVKDTFHPVEVTEGLWIVPEWSTPPDLEATNISLNPGLAFGTGDHPTTKLCLLLLHDLIKGGELVLDYGTGSGILAIAALKFGAASSVGLDIDPQAITAARHNATLNNIGPDTLQLQLVPSNTDPFVKDLWSTNGNCVEVNSEKDEFDVVIANILLNPLLDLADHIVSYAKPGALVALSGIILEQVPTVINRYSDLLEDFTGSKIDDWACISGTKKKAFTGS